MTLLADKRAAAAVAQVPAKPETLLARKRASSPRGEFVELPYVGRAWIELASEVVTDEIEGAVWSIMKALDMLPTAINMPAYDSCKTALTLAWAVRSPDNTAERVGTQDDWRALDVDLIMACGLIYRDVRERLSPVAMGELTQDQLDAIRLAIEKKNPMPLVDAGVIVLSRYLLTTAAPLASSPTTPSSTGESP